MAITAVLGLRPGLSALVSAVRSGTLAADKLGWKARVQHSSYRRFPLFEGLERIAAVGLRRIEIGTDLGLNAKRPGLKADENISADARDEFKVRLADNGLSIPSVFVDLNGKAGQAKRLLEFWKVFNTKILVAEPPTDSFDMLEKLFEEYEVRLAIHNHQKGRSKYWSPHIVLEVCRRRRKKIGACADGGQWARSGLDPLEGLRELKGRIINSHLKDILKKTDRDSRSTVLGESEGSCTESLKELHLQGYKGPIVIDFQHDIPVLLDDKGRNVAFLRQQTRQLLAQSSDRGRRHHAVCSPPEPCGRVI
jgi:L-ribulose-5-phosphate 3-epimerase